ncbi:homocysteine S-methyltransferase family protein [Gilvimarinus algae]|uniref:Homocysteine S-methyltransferase family protein n=1 Tax=Gilvimarinus algae TaxID=3058037 RepID=A0ABT8TC03_9GAMM|nr:homocysteine S-methyltransferase family protein [Gilvimarinus sp. SDUM040014]MDO3381620.1 homocysteine S-methyltransferase family protein [Gilvimarinus sp. SDUM040014]
MRKYQEALPQLGEALFLTDGGLETTLIFHNQVDLPLFAAFDLVKSAEGVEQLISYYRRYLEIAQNAGLGFILESPTWRANRDWGRRLGYTDESLRKANIDCISLMEKIRSEYEHIPVVISGCIGPRGDGYRAATFDAQEAQAYHQEQINTFSETTVDLVSAVTMTNINEAIGIALAAKQCNLPVVISFTVETNGCLPSGETIEQAINLVDLATEHYPAYYMINCAHATHFEDSLPIGKTQLRLKGVRANASKCSHQELDESPTLDDGNPEEFGYDYARLKTRLTGLSVVGGCCGTDHRHIHKICQTLSSKPQVSAN